MRNGILSILLALSTLFFSACSSTPQAPYNWSQVDEYSAWNGKRLIFQLDNFQHTPVTHYTVVIENTGADQLQMVVINPLGVPSFQASLEKGEFKTAQTLLSDRFISQEHLLSCILLSLSVNNNDQQLLEGWHIIATKDIYTLYYNNKVFALVDKTKPGITRIKAKEPDFDIGLTLKSTETL